MTDSDNNHIVDNDDKPIDVYIKTVDKYVDDVLVSKIQENVEIYNKEITGTLKYLNEGSLVNRFGSGYFLALDLSDNDYSIINNISIGILPSNGIEFFNVKEDDDKIVALKIDNTNQKVIINVSNDETSVTKKYDLSSLQLGSN